jgi:hypothetical protein
MTRIYDQKDFDTFNDVIKFAAENPDSKFRHFCVDTQTTVYLSFVVNPDGSFIMKEDGQPDYYMPSTEPRWLNNTPIPSDQGKPMSKSAKKKMAQKQRRK